MKRFVPKSAVVVVISVLTLFFSLSISIHPAGAASLCDRFPSLSSKFPWCRDNPPPPPPPPADLCPNVPGNQTTSPCEDQQCTEQGGTWDGNACALPPPPPPETGNDSRRDECARYMQSPRNSPPESCDICPNVPGVQLIGQCADKMCVDDGGFWNGLSCVDMCPNVPGFQSSTPCADIQCVDDGGSWTGTSCEFPPPPENSLSLCTDALDNDEDSLVDLEDSDCESFKPKIIVTKIVINDNGGTALPSDFSLFVASVATGQISVNSGATTTLPHAGEWIVGEITRPGYEPKGFGGDCANGSPVIAAGETMTCTITNDDIASGGGGAGGGAGGGGAPAPSPAPGGGGGGGGGSI